ncbi:MAG TPA: MurR/RpiR family transcriptional regulator [Solirubrobacteraceae bacterium]|jgi:DNA-binding MurR/RpiR family transcriptional regulator|nr:MurR/RpiR family transcriptional regulator [Solirubrobacteraceae bacterium]
MQTAPRQLSDLFEGLRLTPVQRRIAAHIVEQGSRAAFASSVELAAHVGVSQPSVTRLATALGYQGFGEMQREIQALVLERAPASVHAPEQNKMQRAVQHAIEGLQRLQRQLADLGPVEHAAGKLAQTPVLPVYGSRTAAPLAHQFEFFASKIHPNVRLLRGARSELLDQLSHATELGASAMLAIALPRHPQELLELLGAAERGGLAVVLVTDSALSAATELASHVLVAPVSSDLVFDAAVAPLQLLTVLLEALADATPTRTRRRLERFETLAAEQRYFVEQ